MLFLNLSLLTFPVKINLLSLRSQNPCSSANLLSEISFSSLFTIYHRHTSYLTVLLLKNLLIGSLDITYIYLTQWNNGCFDSSLYFKSNYCCHFISYTTYYSNPSYSDPLRNIKKTMEYHIMFIRLIETIFCYDCMILNYISSKLSALKYPHHIFYRVYKIMIGYAVVFRYTFICSRSSKLHQIARLQIRDSFL